MKETNHIPDRRVKEKRVIALIHMADSLFAADGGSPEKNQIIKRANDRNSNDLQY